MNNISIRKFNTIRYFKSNTSITDIVKDCLMLLFNDSHTSYLSSSSCSIGQYLLYYVIDTNEYYVFVDNIIWAIVYKYNKYISRLLQYLHNIDNNIIKYTGLDSTCTRIIYDNCSVSDVIAYVSDRYGNVTDWINDYVPTLLDIVGLPDNISELIKCYPNIIQYLHSKLKRLQYQSILYAHVYRTDSKRVPWNDITTVLKLINILQKLKINITICNRISIFLHQWNN